MTAPLHEQLRDALPRLTADNYRHTSPASWSYNCIAWAVGTTAGWWWPLPGRSWPDEVPREETVEAFLALFTALGYSSGASASFEVGVEKIALYAAGDMPTHAARQLHTGWWTSKLGPSVDIEHLNPDAVAGGTYGEVLVILGRQKVNEKGPEASASGPDQSG